MPVGNVCAICGEREEDRTLFAQCLRCGSTFHLNPTTGPGKDCGDAALGPTMGVEAVCQRCVDEERSAAAPGDQLVSMFSALTDGQFVPPAAPRTESAATPTPRSEPSTRPQDADGARRRFRRIR